MTSVSVSVSPSSFRHSAAAWTPEQHGSDVDFWSVAEVQNVTLNSADVDVWADLSSNGNNAAGVSTFEPQWNATAWHDGTPAIEFSSGQYMRIANLAATSGNSYLIAAAVQHDSTPGANSFMLYSLSGSGVPAVLERNGAYGIFDAAYKTVGTVTTTQQALVWHLDAAAAQPPARGIIYRNGTDLGALSASDYDATLPAAAAGGPAIGALTTGTSAMVATLKALYVTRASSIITNATEVQKVIDWIGGYAA